MDLPKTLSAIKALIGEGNIEQAFEELVALLDSDPKYADLAQTARINQGELYQVKSQVLKNTIAPEDARLVTNQVADNALQLVRRLEAGKLTFEDPEPTPPRSKAWRYYAIGGAVTLVAAALIGYFLRKNEEECPAYSNDAQYRVMILPFKQTGSMKNFEPEFEIVDGLNKLITKTPRLNAGADVNENYDIEKNYPSFTEAGDIGYNCGVQMVVWGKIRKEGPEDYKIDVFYKLLDESGNQSTGDTTLANLLKTKDEGQQLTRDVVTVTNLLYIVLANRAKVPIAANLIEMAPTPVTTTSSTDSSWMYTALALAENYKNNKQEQKAIETYDRVLETFPDNPEARQKRGALLYKKGDFAAAAQDLEFAVPEAKAPTADLLKIRAEAALKSGNPAKALDDLRRLRQTGREDLWINNKIQEARDTMTALQKRLDDIEKQAQVKPRDTEAQLRAAKTNASLGRHDKALTYANKALQSNPKNAEAVNLKVETQLAKGDTVAAERTIKTAVQNGVNTKSVEKWRPVIDRLETSTGNKQ